MNNYIVPELCHTIGFNKNSIIFKKNVIDFIIRNYTYEAGVRKLKERVFEIIREINGPFSRKWSTIYFESMRLNALSML